MKNEEQLKIDSVIKKWYSKLGFPSKYDKEFEMALEAIDISEYLTAQTLDTGCEDGKRNLLSALYLCEEVKEKYTCLSLPEDVLIDTLRDIVTWCETWSKVKGELYLGELEWLKRHLTLNIFKLGRLQYSFKGVEYDVPKYGLKKGDPIMEVHIPEGERFTTESLSRSIDMARSFFAKYFPDYEYKYFTCHSWLLDDTLKKYLPAESGIIKFGDMFDKVHAVESPALLRYLFPWDTTPENLKDREPSSSLAAKVQKAFFEGEVFHETLGVIKK